MSSCPNCGAAIEPPTKDCVQCGAVFRRSPGRIIGICGVVVIVLGLYIADQCGYSATAPVGKYVDAVEFMYQRSFAVAIGLGISFVGTAFTIASLFVRTSGWSDRAYVLGVVPKAPKGFPVNARQALNRSEPLLVPKPALEWDRWEAAIPKAAGTSYSPEDLRWLYSWNVSPADVPVALDYLQDLAKYRSVVNA